MAGTICLAFAASALAAPAGQEYLPKVPKAAGKGVVAHGEKGAGASILEPEARGAKQKGGSGSGENPSASGASSSGDSSGGSALLNPVVLLVIAGVMAAAVGMTLRRRREQPQSDQGEVGGPREPTTERPTPAGEIVGGELGQGSERDSQLADEQGTDSDSDPTAERAPDPAREEIRRTG